MHIFTFLVSAVGFLLIVFSLHLLFTKNGNLLLNRFLSIPLLARFGQVCIFLIVSSSYQGIFPIIQKICIPLFFVAPVCTYLYVRGFIRGDSSFRKGDIIHFIPVLLAVIHIMPIPLSSPINWDIVASQVLKGGQLSITERTGLFSAQIYNIVQALVVGGYLLATWYYVIISGFFKHTSWDINKTWLTFYLSTSTFFKLLSFVALIFNYLNRSYTSSNAFLIISCIVLLFMMAFVIYRPRILYGYIILSPKANITITEPQLSINYKPYVSTDLVLKSVNNLKTASKSKLSSEQQLQFADVIKEHMEKEKPFLLHEFQMKDLTNAVNIPIHHCSLVINSIMNKNFRDWLNSYRIQHFIKEYPILSDKMTIEAVAFNSGFKNMTTFYNAFKKEIGQMPSSYFSKNEL